MSELWLIPISFLTSAIAGALGMGGGVLLIALMPGLVPVQAILPLHALVQLGSNASRAALRPRLIAWQMVPALLLGALAGAFLGGTLYAQLELHWLPAIVGVLILAITWLPLPPVRRGGQVGLCLLGFYQTGVGMLAGATGPLGAAVLARFRLQRDWLVVNTAVYMSINHLLRTLAFAILGFSFAAWWSLICGMIAAAIIGSWCGTLVRERIPEIDFARAFRWLVTVLALRMIALSFF
ncbi:MAG: sulfite exporter TauE/SafE family protein [Pseudomonadota bacterium]